MNIIDKIYRLLYDFELSGMKPKGFIIGLDEKIELQKVFYHNCPRGNEKPEVLGYPVIFTNKKSMLSVYWDRS